ncbi:MAG: hypothetical protein CTY31_14010 [Hyphomicrobium sp.]|nr:MAG: hypothetical protein CTY31_14010 [Hyphomicrobium sp.]
MARIISLRIAVVILAMVNVGIGAVAVAAPTTTDHLPLDWPSAPRLDEKNAKAQELADSSRAAYLAREFTQAIALYTELLKLKPSDARIYYNRANAFYAAHDIFQAIADYTTALSLNSNSYLALMGRGNALSQSRRFSEAIADFDRALELNPDEFLILYNRGIAKGRSGDKSGALYDFTHAIKMRPDDHQSYAARGDVLASQGNDASARADYQRALELNPANSHAAQKLREYDGAASEATSAGASKSMTTERSQISGAQQIARLAIDACFKNGADETALRSMANSEKWNFVGDSELKKHSTMAASMVGGWTFDGDTGAFAVMQSRENVTPAIHICSVTTKLGQQARFGEVKSAFEMTAGVAVSDVNASAGSETFGYWLRHTPECESRISLVHTAHSGIVTVRILHGRVRGVNASDKSYPNIDTQ